MFVSILLFPFIMSYLPFSLTISHILYFSKRVLFVGDIIYCTSLWHGISFMASLFMSSVRRPTLPSAVHIDTTIRVSWVPPTMNSPSDYEITLFAGAGGTTVEMVPVSAATACGDGSYCSHDITSLSSIVTYYVSVTAVGDNGRVSTRWPVLAARRECYSIEQYSKMNGQGETRKRDTTDHIQCSTLRE